MGSATITNRFTVIFSAVHAVVLLGFSLRFVFVVELLQVACTR